jgi:uncharacterized OsmC-like protein
MAGTTVHIRTVKDASLAVGWAGQRTVTIDRAEAAGGMGLGFNGGELLLLALGACYTNDIFREAAGRGIEVTGVQVEVNAAWGGEPVRAQDVTFTATVEAAASEQEILELIAHTDRVAEIHNSLRMGAAVTLTRARAIPV